MMLTETPINGTIQPMTPTMRQFVLNELNKDDGTIDGKPVIIGLNAYIRK
jgi:hypothetical protein